MLQKSTKEKILQLFFKEPTKEHYLKNISRKIRVAHTSIKPILNLLVKEEIITKKEEERGTRIFPMYKANLENKQYYNLKKISNYKEILESNIIQFLEKEINPTTTILFGSYAKGEDTEESDIDIFLIGKEKKIDIKKYEKLLGRTIELHIRKSFEKIPKELKNNLINGIVIQGFLKGY